MATVLKVRRISNPRGRRRKMSKKQLRYFGTKRQRNSVRRRRTRRNVQGGMMTAHGFVPFRSSVDYDPDRAGDDYGARTDNLGFVRKPKAKRAKKAKARRTKKGHRPRAKAKRKRNPALVVTLGAANPRRRRHKVATRRRRRRVANPRRRYSRRRRAANPRRRRTARRTNYRRRRRNRAARVVVIGTRRRNYRRRRNGRGRRRVNRRSYRRRNPSFMGGSIASKSTLMVLGGGFVGVMAAKFIPTLLPISMLGSLGSSAVGRVLITGGSAVIAGWAAEKFVGNKGFADGVMFGGLMQAASVALNAFMPGIYGQLGIGLGDLMPGAFSVPQNPIRAGIPAPAPANARVTMNGLARAYGAAY